MLLLVLVPLALAAVAFALPAGRRRPRVLLAGAIVHAAGVAALWVLRPAPALGGWLAVDAAGLLALTTASAVFLVCAVYVQGYLAAHPERDDRVFVSSLLVLLAAMTAVSLAQHLGLLWVVIEVTTLSTAPLIYFKHDARSLEATWKYLMVCSIGIALALLGTFLLAVASAGPGGPRSLLVADLVAAAPALSRPWVRGAFVFLLAGYGTKMGLAPFHAWKPDAYGEAPGVLGALLSGGVTNLAFLALVRVLTVCHAAGEGAFARGALLGVGLLSMAVAAIFIVGQRDVKRLLAYSSVEHMGILALGVGLGGAASSGAFFHMVNNGLTKGVLFLTAGNIQRAFGSKHVDHLRGAARLLPLSGPLFLAGFLAVTGSPPFSPFFSEFAILSGALQDGRFLVSAAYLLLLAVIFVAMGVTVLRVVQGDPGDVEVRPEFRDAALTAGPPLALMLVVLALGLFVPRGLLALFDAAAAAVGGRS
ncbi:complex I subunit 5 family protein [Anaeromyxobacter oryzae]|uniref:Hydrogenase n=1 Tax=Anaeromyxobacter oryzae TaxID=2918170 RepID=A0ABN6MNN5_9BACT|nr:proton-conducting transporter membrane subunit [Anaeromyxobacter oryzae]BDG02570.1 hydrogenase [Anaeromyxobacter oryzae]